MNGNIGWKYYKDYYHGFDFKRAGKGNDTYQEDHFKPKNEAIRQLLLQDQPAGLLGLGFQGLSTLELETTYPGLMSGTGLSHETKSMGESKLGFAFDHTSGLPYLPASSVKGVLRSMFPQRVNRQKAPKLKEGREQRYKLMYYLLQQATQWDEQGLKQRLTSWLETRGIEAGYAFQLKGEALGFIDLLELEMFEGIQPDLVEKKEELLPELLPQSVYARDIFFDAYPAESRKHGGRFVDFDFITPHKHEDDENLDPFANPTPIKFLKVLPAVVFRFQFRLKDGLLSAHQKLGLIRQMLLFHGVGAKTNVGYGQLQQPVEIRRFEVGELVEATITKTLNEDRYMEETEVEVQVHETETTIMVNVGKKKAKRLQKDEVKQFEIKEIDKDGNIIRLVIKS
ncbi:MAG: type III-B CRISPR module RAMP protein Cmr6 [Bacteroidetes bacterium]|nr:MAG: type III-B CRISPR module RAMP protein Cmr6 [Bacteroidota bacterium]